MTTHDRDPGSTTSRMTGPPSAMDAPHFHDDLRGYLDALERRGDLNRVTREVSAHLEAAAETRLSVERRLPAPLFENIAGVAPGFRLLGGVAALSSHPDKPMARVATTLGMPVDTSAADIVDRLCHVMDAPAVPPVVVSRDRAACKQNVLLGDDATLDRFPIPRVHEEDGERYVNTWGIVVTSTPDKRWTNWAITRVMYLDGKRMTGLVRPTAHLGKIWQEWVDIGEPMPYALVQGGPPAVCYAGGLPIPYEVDEADFVGALHGRPVELVACESVDLLVPATSEVVVEGHVSVTRDATEGPFGEYAGYMPTTTSQEPVFSVEAITHRDDPIWPLVAEGRPVDETHTVSAVGHAAVVLRALRRAHLPVTLAWMPPSTAAHWLVVTVADDWRERLPGLDTAALCHRIGEVLSEVPSGRLASHVFVLDDDIDPTDDAELMWALGTRVHPTLRREEWTGPILPLVACYTPEERQRGRGPVVVHDALQAPAGAGRQVQSSFAQAYPAEIRARVLAAQQRTARTRPECR
ncbi:UbiD-like decarboxylase [Streptomyces canarius]|uniref:Pyrrole-2-carboxylic acid decarboxylase n=2 Tax=Streptomyces TaxID=1883 RepID=A0ABQ3D6E9_9ACTN|nr:UbiD-like decarboxylase [Streptomyces canarius]